MAQVRGIGEEAPDGWVLVENEVPMPKGLKEILETLRSVFKQGKVQSVHIELGKPIRYSQFVREGEADRLRKEEEASGFSLGQVARNVPMEELPELATDPKFISSAAIMVQMILAIERRRLYLTHVGIGVNSRFIEWMGLDPIAYGGIERLGGAELVRDKHIPDDNMILFAGPQAGGRADQISYAIKCHLTLPEDVEVEEPDAQEAE